MLQHLVVHPDWLRLSVVSGMLGGGPHSRSSSPDVKFAGSFSLKVCVGVRAYMCVGAHVCMHTACLCMCINVCILLA